MQDSGCESFFSILRLLWGAHGGAADTGIKMKIYNVNSEDFLTVFSHLLGTHKGKTTGCNPYWNKLKFLWPKMGSKKMIKKGCFSTA